jgi:hypothetical protein
VRTTVAAVLSATLIGLLICGASLALALETSPQRGSSAATKTLNESEFFVVHEITETYITGHGLASGTIVGTGSTKMTLLNATRAKGEFTSGSSHDSVTAKWVASYRIAGKLAHFTGTVTSLHGTGRYSRAVGVGIKFTGAMDRVLRTMTMSATGQWRP